MRNGSANSTSSLIFDAEKQFGMHNHFQLTNVQFEQQFQQCTLNPALFNHEAHLRLAWIHIKNYGRETAIQNICSQLVRFTASVGAADKYNKTLTVAAVKAVHHFMQRSSSETFYDFITEYPRLKFNFKELMAAHYKKDIYQSEKAKKEFLEPDLLPFD